MKKDSGLVLLAYVGDVLGRTQQTYWAVRWLYSQDFQYAGINMNKGLMTIWKA